MSNNTSTTNGNNNIFQDVLNDAGGVEAKLLGPTYNYAQNIKTPAQIGMSDKGSLAVLGNDINGLIQYVELLVSGKSKASVPGGPLGNRFFLKTGAKCSYTDASGAMSEQDRYIYVDNKPEGNIPFISSNSISGANFSEFKGLIPGAISNLNALNPYAIMQSFLSGSTPTCIPLTMETIDISNNTGIDTHYVTTVDIQNMDPCSFPDRKNPVNGRVCKETFVGGMEGYGGMERQRRAQRMMGAKAKIKNSKEGFETKPPKLYFENDHEYYDNNYGAMYGVNNYDENYANDMMMIGLPKDSITQLYLLGLSGLAIYLLTKMMKR